MVNVPRARNGVSSGSALIGFGALLLFVLVAWGLLADAQGQPVRLVGRVQWISANTMGLIPDTGGLPIEIDISQVPLDNYRTLTEGDWIVVIGVVSPDGRKVLATAIAPAGGS